MNTAAAAVARSTFPSTCAMVSGFLMESRKSSAAMTETGNTAFPDRAHSSTVEIARTRQPAASYSLSFCSRSDLSSFARSFIISRFMNVSTSFRQIRQSAEKPSSEQQHRLPPKEGNRQPPAHSQENNPEEALQTKIRSAFRTVYSPLR